MGVFNYLKVETGSGLAMIQFHWGWEELIEYQLGDTLQWRDFPKPDRTAGRLEVPGSREQTAAEAATPREFYKIIIRNDVITGLERIPESEWLAMQDPVFRD